MGTFRYNMIQPSSHYSPATRMKKALVCCRKKEPLNFEETAGQETSYPTTCMFWKLLWLPDLQPQSTAMVGGFDKYVSVYVYHTFCLIFDKFMS